MVHIRRVRVRMESFFLFSFVLSVFENGRCVHLCIENHFGDFLPLVNTMQAELHLQNENLLHILKCKLYFSHPTCPETIGINLI